MNNLTATLNAEKKTIGDALDAVGPAIDVLDDQHNELIDMLGALEELGRVGTRVINASKEDVLKILGHLSPVLDKLYEAGHELGPGVNLLVSFPFPKAANDIVQGDFADTTFFLDLDFDNLFHNLGIPEIHLPDPGQVLNAVQRCLRSGSLTSAACAKVLQSASLLHDLQHQCHRPALKDSPVCVLLNALPDIDLGGLLNRGRINDSLNPLTGGVDGLSQELVRGVQPDSSSDPSGLLGVTAT
jgi:phospholipid/cholesterol/gamma-HCH transport system substrate-binding protein